MANLSYTPYAGISLGDYESGTYGGSVQKSLHPNVYQYWYLHAGQLSDKSVRDEFREKFEEFLKTTTVNGAISLIAFLQLVDTGNQEKLHDVYARYNREMATGSHTQPLSILIFRTSEADTPIELYPYQADVKGPLVHAFFSFVRQHGHHFKSQIPDAFMRQYYQRFVEK